MYLSISGPQALRGIEPKYPEPLFTLSNMCFCSQLYRMWITFSKLNESQQKHNVVHKWDTFKNLFFVSLLWRLHNQYYHSLCWTFRHLPLYFFPPRSLVSVFAKIARICSWVQVAFFIESMCFISILNCSGQKIVTWDSINHDAISCSFSNLNCNCSKLLKVS